MAAYVTQTILHIDFGLHILTVILSITATSTFKTHSGYDNIPTGQSPTIRDDHLQSLDVLKFVGVPLFDLSVFSRGEEQMGFGYKLKKHDTREKKDNSKKTGNDKQQPSGLMSSSYYSPQEPERRQHSIQVTPDWTQKSLHLSSAKTRYIITFNNKITENNTAVMRHYECIRESQNKLI